MEIIRVDPRSPNEKAIARAAEVLREGRLVAFPTETVYGLGANALDHTAVDRIYAAKERPTYNPLIVHVADIAGAQKVASEWPEAADKLAALFWPGPLTMVLPKRDEIPDGVTAGLGSVAVRIPAHPVALALIRTAGLPVAAPSANRSMMLSPTTADHVVKSLGEAVDVILDGGPTSVGIESTVVDLTSGTPRILRPGMITAEELEKVVGPLETIEHVKERRPVPRLSPGMLDRHYSPDATLVLVDAANVESTVEAARANGNIVGALVITAPSPIGMVTRLPDSAVAYAARLYESLHHFDDAGCDIIVVERVPDGADWAGVRDRLERAATPPID